MSTAPTSPTTNSPRKALTCVGDPPLDARWEPWMEELLADPTRCSSLVAVYGSPLHIHHTEPFRRNIERLREAAKQADVDAQIFFARKANKCLTYVHAANLAGAGVDVASHEELRQTLEAAVPPESIIVTSAFKPIELIELAVGSGVTIAIDNDDEAERIQLVCAELQRTARVAIRLAFRNRRTGALSRFGYPVTEVPMAIRRWQCWPARRLEVVGLHFHLDGYAAADRVEGLDAALSLADELQSDGLADIGFVDIGGGFPMSYLDDPEQWDDFWSELRSALGGGRDAVTYHSHGYGLQHHDGEIVGTASAYPHAQSPTGAAWLTEVLSSPLPSDATTSVAEALRERSIRLHCEPGRALLDGCGMTVARVEHRKVVDGETLVGLAMNSTNCRSQKSELMADPRLIRLSSEPTEPTAGYLAGGYCSEGDMIMHRRLRFPAGVGVGDLVAFPNTAGYLMHFTESRSHQFPLPLNIDLSGSAGVLDACDST